MSNSQLQKRYLWAGVGEDIKALISELTEAEAEEDSGLYLLMMHFKNEEDLNFFTPSDKKEVNMLLSKLIEDSKRHYRTLSRLGKVFEAYQRKMEKL